MSNMMARRPNMGNGVDHEKIPSQWEEEKEEKEEEEEEEEEGRRFGLGEKLGLLQQ